MINNETERFNLFRNQFIRTVRREETRCDGTDIMHMNDMLMNWSRDAHTRID